MVDSLKERLLAVERDLDTGRYRKGAWQRLIGEIERLSHEDKVQLGGDVSRVSRKLHGQNGFPALPFEIGYVAEAILFVISVFLLFQDALIARVVGVGLLALTLQPLMKVTMGLLLGVRYDYTYLWYFEPRFKMRYGTYLLLPGTGRILLHLVGSLPTPIAMWVGYMVLQGYHDYLGLAMLVLFFLAVVLQIGAFVAELLGLRMIGPFRLSQLTSPATAAAELKKLLAHPSQ